MRSSHCYPPNFSRSPSWGSIERQLQLLLIHGDAHPAFGQLLDDVEPCVRKTAEDKLRVLFGHVAYADDAVQEWTIAVVSPGSTNWNPQKPAHAYARGILEKVCLQIRRKHRVIQPLSDNFELRDDRCNPFGDAWRKDLPAPIRSAIDQLPEPQARAIRMQYFEGLSLEEAALREGTTAGAMATRRWRAHRKLKRLLEHLREFYFSQ